MRTLLTFVSVLLLNVAAYGTIGAGLQMQLGNPSNATTDPANHTRYLIERPQYSLDYNDTTRQGNWVSWHLTTTDVGGSGRSEFQQDTTLPAGFYQVLTSDYSGSGYDRGHLCPSADRTVTVADNMQVFYMTNMMPQTPDNNQGVWASFETYCRSLASAGNEVLIITGPGGFSGSTIASGVAIPGYTWKIVVVVPFGPGSAVSRITASTRIIALKVPNIAGVRSTPWQSFVTSVAQLEADTGFTFLTQLPASTREALRTVIDGQTTSGAPVIASHPAAQTTVVGGSASFAVTATGDAPLSYQWYRDDDAPIAGATSATLVLNPVKASDLGSYYVVVTNDIGSATSSSAPLVVMGVAPSITSSPTSQTVNAGTTVTFAVVASGSPTLTYQWRKDTLAIPGATGSTLTLGNVQSAAIGAYDVVVSNGSGSAPSAAALLSVVDVAPSILTSPLSKAAITGSTTSFSVAATGTAPLQYQWRKDGMPLANGGAYSGATSPTLAISNVAVVHGGTYDVVVTNALGFATSALATLTINPPAPASLSWSFGTTGAESAAPAGLPADITGGVLTQGNNNGTTPLLTTTSASPTSGGFSGGMNAGAAARTGALVQTASGSAYFEFTLAPVAGKRLYVSGLSFGTRSTGTGPQAYAIYTSLDGYSAAVATGLIANNSSWALKTATLSPVTSDPGQSVTFRIYGYNGAGGASANTANWRIDDLSVLATTLFPPPVAPVVTDVSPANGATGVAITAPITVTFNEAVSFTGSWFSIVSAANGPVAATVTGGPTTFSLTPPSFFSYNDTVTVTIHGAAVVDQASGSIPGTDTTTVTFTTASYVPPTPPSVTTQPVSTTVNVGDTASFTVAASGTAPLTYQWRKAGQPIAATTATLTLVNAQLTDIGAYDCVVTNVAGSDVSAAASLTVLEVPPTIAVAPVAQMAAVGDSVSFSVVAGGTAPFTYVWRQDGTALIDGPTVTGAATSTLTLSNLTYLDSSKIDVVVTNAVGSATSVAVPLAVTSGGASVVYWDFATAAPTSGVPVGITGGTVTQGNNNGTTALLTSSSASGAYAGASGGNNAGAAARIGALNQGANGSAYFEFTFTPDAGRQFVATSLSFGSRSTGTGPKAYALFTSVDNFATPVASGVLLSDSTWRMITPSFAGATGAAGVPVTFRIYAYNGAGGAGVNTANWRIDDVRLTAGLLAVPLPPTITTDPVSRTATVGDSVTFSVAATGTAPFSYVWRKNGVAIPEATGSTLVLTAITSADAGSYDCVVTNVASSATSAAATLTVNKAAASVELGALNVVYDGTPKVVTATTAPGAYNVVLTYDGLAEAPVSAGSYAIVATIDDPDYTGSATGTLVIAQAPATVTLGGLNATYTGSPVPVSATTAPAGLDVHLTYDGATTAPAAAGSYAVIATVADLNFSGTATGTLVISRATAQLSLSGLTQAYDGQPKPVTVVTSPAALDVIVTYNGSTQAPTYPGTYAVSATLVDDNYEATVTGELRITVTALVRRAPVLNGGLDGSLQVLSGQSFVVNSNAWVAGDLLVPGTPVVNADRRVTFGGVIDATGAAAPANYTIALNGNTAVRHVVRRVDPIALPVVSAPPAPVGTRSVVLGAGQSAGDYTTVRNLTLNGKAGTHVVPAGTYGAFTVNSGSTLVLGTAGATAPAVYHLQSLTVNHGGAVQIDGPVILHLANGLSLSGVVGSATAPDRLTLLVASGGVTVNGNAVISGAIVAPNGSVIINGTVRGTVTADALTINGNGLLEQP